MLKPNISRNNIYAFGEYGALPHRPTKGLSGRPLETFGRKYVILFLKYQFLSLTAQFSIIPSGILSIFLLTSRLISCIMALLLVIANTSLNKMADEV